MVQLALIFAEGSKNRFAHTSGLAGQTFRRKNVEILKSSVVGRRKRAKERFEEPEEFCVHSLSLFAKRKRRNGILSHLSFLFFVKYIDKPGCWFFNSALKISKSSLAERIRLLFLFEYRVASCVAFSFKFIFSCVSRHIDCKGLRAKKELRDQFHFIKISLKVKKHYLSED